MQSRIKALSGTWLLCLLFACNSSSGSKSEDGGGSSPDAGKDASGSEVSGTGGQTTDGGPGAGGTTATIITPFAGSCTSALPSEAQLADTSTPTTVVGSGTASSCTYTALASAIAGGGVITFDCGAAPVVIPVTATLDLPTDRNTVLDGGGKVTLDGGGKVRILSWNSPGWMTNTHTLTLQRMALVKGKTTPAEAIPACTTQPNAKCSTGFNDGEGGALTMRDGGLRAIGVTFENNQAAPLGPDTGGGAVYLFGCQPAYIAGSIFRNNQASNAGALGGLFVEENIFNSLFEGNAAVGNGANNSDETQCSCINNGQNQVGSGGNGGAIYSDGVKVSMNICGSTLRNNTANEFGAAIFFTSNDASQKGNLSIKDSTFTSNAGNGVWEAKPGISTNANLVTPVNTTFN